MSTASLSFHKKHVRERQYKLKKKYFAGVPADKDCATSPDPSLTDEQWSWLVGKWLASKNKVYYIPSHFPFL
jgi:hypothetical protein